MITMVSGHLGTTKVYFSMRYCCHYLAGPPFQGVYIESTHPEFSLMGAGFAAIEGHCHHPPF